jgi:chitin disaccharide deacetylase
MESTPQNPAPPASISLVVNADEFGLSREISRGILTAHREGIVTSTSVLGNCANLPDIVALLREAPTLGVGLHLTLVQGHPVSDPAALRTLVNREGLFPQAAREHLARWLKSQLDPAQIEREFDAQVRRALDAGLVLDHLDTHHHIGFLPPVGRAIETVARRHGIPGLRSTAEEPSLGWITDLARGALATLVGGLAWLTRRQLGAIRHGPLTWGYAEAGRLDEVRILEIIGRLGPGSHELICHPGETDDESAGVGFLSTEPFRRKREVDALTSPLVRRALETRGIRLCRWADLF